MRVQFRSGLSEALHGSGLPYGFTLVIWSTGSVVRAATKTPGLLEIALFALGAIAAYGGLRLATHHAPKPASSQLASTGHLIRSGAIQVAGIAAAIGAAWLVSRERGLWAWLLAPLVATALYFLVVGLEMGAEDAETRRKRSRVTSAPRTSPPPSA